MTHETGRDPRLCSLPERSHCLSGRAAGGEGARWPEPAAREVARRREAPGTAGALTKASVCPPTLPVSKPRRKPVSTAGCLRWQEEP